MARAPMIGKNTSNVIFFSARKRKGRDVMLEQIVHEHGAALQRFMRVRLALEPDREDIIQEVFLRLARIDDLQVKFSEKPDTVRSYLFSIATNLIRDNARREKVRQKKNHISYEENIGPCNSLTPEDALRTKQKLKAMNRALGQVKPEQKRAFILSRMENLSYAEIAADLGVSVSTVEKYISTVLYVLRKGLTL
ncbi:MAG: RNA polymerase sigma factor [Sphingomonadales bacterium]